MSLADCQFGFSFIEAVNEHKLDQIHKCLRLGVSVNFTDTKRKTALHIAAEKGYVDLCEFFIKKHAKPDSTDSLGNLPLHYAAANGNYRICQLLCLMLDKNVVNMKNDLGKTPLHLALENGCLKICNYLIIHGADVTLTDDLGNTSLHMAAVNGLDEICPMVIRHASVNHVNAFGSTALHLAAKKGNYDVCQKLVVVKGIDVYAIDGHGDTAFDIVRRESGKSNSRFFIQIYTLLDKMMKNDDREVTEKI